MYGPLIHPHLLIIDSICSVTYAGASSKRTSSGEGCSSDIQRTSSEGSTRRYRDRNFRVSEVASGGSVSGGQYAELDLKDLSRMVPLSKAASKSHNKMSSSSTVILITIKPPLNKYSPNFARHSPDKLIIIYFSVLKNVAVTFINF